MIYFINELHKISPITLSPDNIRTNWIDFRPRDPNKRVRYYQSSASGGEEAGIAIWTRDDLEKLVAYIVKTLPEIYPQFKSHLPDAGLILGPYGWYQEENTELMWRLGIYDVYFIAVETHALKKLLVENISKVQERLEPTFKRVGQVILRDEREFMVRYPPLLYDVLKPAADRIRYFITSGVDITPQTIEKINFDFPNSTVIPFYGDSLFGDAIGINEGNKIIYYPPPGVFIFPVKKTGNNYELCEYGERGYKAFIKIGDGALYVFIDKKETIGREKPRFNIEVDGFSNPSRHL